MSEKAIQVTRENVGRLGLGDRVTLFCGDLFAPIEQKGFRDKIDLVVCNPPYIPSDSLKSLAPEIVEHKPIVALDAGAYGIGISRRLIADARACFALEESWSLRLGPDKTNWLQAGSAQRWL